MHSLKSTIAVFTLLVFVVLAVSVPAHADQVDDLIQEAKSPSPKTRHDAIDKLGAIKDRRAVDHLIKILRSHPDFNTRWRSVLALQGNYGHRDPRALKELIEAFKIDSYVGEKKLDYFSVRSTALRAIGFFPNPRALEFLLKAMKMKSENEWILKNATLALGFRYKFNEPRALDALIRAARDSKYSRNIAVNALGKFNNPRVVDPLIRALRDPGEWVRVEAIKALGRRKEPRVVDALIPALSDKEAMVRQIAVVLLGKIGAKRAAKFILPLLKDPDSKVRAVTANVLEKLKVSKGTIKRADLSPRDKMRGLIKELAGTDLLYFGKREKIIQLARRVNPPPAIPEQAKQHMVRAQALVKTARSVEDYKKAAEEFQMAANLAPWWPAAYYNLAVVLEKDRQFYFAAKYMKLYLKAAPEARDAKDVEVKIQELQIFRKRKGKSEKLIKQAADLFNNLGRKEEAIDLFEEAVKQDPGSWWGRVMLGKALVRVGRYKEAIPEFKEAMRLGIVWLSIYGDVGYAYEKLGNDDGAISIYQKGIRNSQWAKDIWAKDFAYVHQRLGIIYERKGEYRKAIEHYRSAIKFGSPNKSWIQSRIRNLGG